VSTSTTLACCSVSGSNCSIEYSSTTHISQKTQLINITIMLNCSHAMITQRHICNLLCLHDQKKTPLCIQSKEERRWCLKFLKENGCIRDWLIGWDIFKLLQHKLSGLRYTEMYSAASNSPRSLR
jgi:hypothetical protein